MGSIVQFGTAGFWEGDKKYIQQEQLDILKDMVKMNALIATELIQLVENSSRQLRGAIPDSCKIQHGELRRQMVEIAEKWNDNSEILR